MALIKKRMTQVSSKDKAGVHFSLFRNGVSIPNVVWFANWAIPLWDAYRKEWYNPPCFRDRVPDTWMEGYSWADLNIMRSAIFKYRPGFGVFPVITREIDHEGLFHFIGAFLDKHPNGIYMHIFHSRLPSKSG